MADDVLDLLIQDHREVEQMFDELKALTHDTDEQDRKDLLARVTVELVRHAVGEETIVYPLMRKVLDDGDAKADHEIEEHTQVEKLLDDLDGADPLAHRQTVQQLIDSTLHHVQEEEQEMFPQLRAKVARDELEALAPKLDAIKKAAPTHPHPLAPNTPPLNQVVGLPTGIVDRLRDLITGRPTG